MNYIVIHLRCKSIYPMNKNILYFIFFISLLFCSACKKEKNVGQPMITPGVETVNVKDVTAGSCIVEVRTTGTDVFHSREMGVMVSTNKQPDPKNGDRYDLDGDLMCFSLKVTGLKASTTYYCRAFLLGDGIYYYGEIKSFTTQSFSANVTTLEADDITYKSALLQGKVNLDNDVSDAEGWFFYSEQETDVAGIVSNGKKILATYREDNTFAANLTEISSHKTYHYVACAKLQGKECLGEPMSFVTKEIQASLQLAEPQVKSIKEIIIEGKLNLGTPVDDISLFLLYNDGVVSDDSVALLEANTIIPIEAVGEDGTFKLSGTDFAPNSTYNIILAADLYDSTFFSSVRTFSTPDIEMSILTKNAENVTESRAELLGSLICPSEPILEKTVWFLTSEAGEDLNTLQEKGRKVKAELKDDGTTIYALDTVFTSNSTHYYVACADIQHKLLYGEIKSFTTLDFTSSTETLNASKVGVSFAILNGRLTINSTGQMKTKVSFRYSNKISEKEALISSGKEVVAEPATGGFFSTGVEKLDSDNIYYYVACSEVNGRKQYGDVVSFKTDAIEAETTTIPATGINKFSALIGGHLAVEGASAKQETFAWMLWSDQYRDIKTLKNLGHMKYVDIQNNGDFRLEISDLHPGTTYHYIACTKINDHEEYGEVLSFRSKDYEYTATPVDLGLSVKWASCDLGSVNPSERGPYYAWGETESKDNFDWNSYRWSRGNSYYVSKYCNNPTYGANRLNDGKLILDSSDDAASVRLKGTWHIPTQAEWNELMSNCAWVWTTLELGSGMSRVSGYRVTSKKTGNSIFLPASGWYAYDEEEKKQVLYYVGEKLRYQSSSLDEDYPISNCSFYGSESGYGWNNYYRSAGVTVRPVCQ